jgi:putative transposase
VSLGNSAISPRKPSKRAKEVSKGKGKRMSHTFTHIVIHLVFGTKDRAPLISIEIKEALFAYMGGIIREIGGKAIIVNGMPDHVHLLLSLPPTLAPAEVVRVVKANSSKWVHEKWLARRTFGWQQGYGAFSVSRSGVKDVEDYIAGQEEHHRKMSFQEEFAALLKRHGIEYDERYLWK